MIELRQSVKAGNKRFVAFMMALLMVIGCLSITQKANAMELVIPPKGQVMLTGDISLSAKDNVRYTITSNGDGYYTITFSGQGRMKSFNMTCHGYEAPFASWEDYDKITDIIIEEGITEIPDYFMYGSSFNDICIPSTVEKFGTYAFGSCKIGTFTFADNSSLSTFGKNFMHKYVELSDGISNIPSDVKVEGVEAFAACVSFTENVDGMHILDGKYILDVDNENLKLDEDGVLYIPDGVEYIASGSFWSEDIKKVVIPDSIRNIQDNAFAGCENLTEIDIPQGCEWDYISYCSFPYYYSPDFNIIGDVLLNITEDYVDSDGKLVIPAGIKTIGACATECISDKEPCDITSITYEEGCELEYIGIRAFCDWKNLSSIELPDTVKVIDDYAFSYAGISEELHLPAGLEYIGEEAFSKAFKADTNLVIPASVKYIGEFAFGERMYSANGYIKGLSFEKNSSVEYIGKEAFEAHMISSCELPASIEYIGDDAFSRYAVAEADVFSFEEGCNPYVGYGSFSSCYDEKAGFILGNTLVAAPSGEGTFVVPEDVENIAVDALYGANYSTIDLNNVKFVSADAIVECEQLETLIAPCSARVNSGWLLVECNGFVVKTAKGSPFDNALKTLKYSYYGDTKYLPSYTMDYSLSHNCRIVFEPASPSKAGVASTKCVDCGYIETDIVNKPAKITLDASSYEYKGSAIVPKVTVTDSIGKVISADNYTVKCTNNSGPGTGKITVTFNGEKYTGSMSANFTITLTVNQPAISSVTATSSGMTVAWNKVADATGYKLYRSVNGGSYSLLKTITSNATVSFADTTATTNGAKYEYKLIAYKTVGGKDYNSDYSAVKSAYRVNAVGISSLANASSGITVKWAKNDQATGYYLYRSVNGGSYTLLKTITSNATVSYTDTAATTNGAKYQYKLVAYKTVSGTTYKSAESAVNTIYRVNAVGISSLANASSGITVKWAKNDQATGYYLYRSVNGGAYSLAKNITSNATVSYTDTTATTNGAKYQYKLVAYKTVSSTTYKSAESAVKTIYRVNAVGISGLTNASSGVTIKWAKNASATGYKLYRSVNGGAYSLLKTITSNATVSYTDTTATTNGAKYQYKMVAYKTVSGTTYTSTYCGVKTIYRVKAVGISSLANASTGITVKWAKNTSATGYKLYRSVNGGAFSLLKTITSNATVSYTDTKATTNGAKYQYKIVAYKTVSGATYTSTYSGAKTIYRLSRPAISSATNSAAGKVTVKWNKNDKASGYKIKYTVGTTTKTVKVTSSATVSKVLSSLTKGKTYSISVQSYKMVGSTPYYSAWSAAKSVKIVK